MARITDHYKDIVDFLSSYLSGYDHTEESGEYTEQIERYLNRLRCGDRDLVCSISEIHIKQGVRIMDLDNAVCLIVANCERAVLDLLRCIPVNKEFLCFFDAVYYNVVAEYLYCTAKEKKSYCLKGLRLSDLRGINRDRTAKLHNMIGSKKDEVVSEFKQYTALKARIATEHIVMEGVRMVKRALEDGQQVEKVVCCDNMDGGELAEIIEICEKNKIAYYSASQGIMAVMTTTNPVPEIICSARTKVRSQKDLIITKNKNVFLVLDGVSNPDNLGMILRTADASGVHAVVLLSGSAHHYNKNAIRGARGAVGRIPIYFSTDDFEFMDILHTNHFKIMGTSARFQSDNFYDVGYDSDNIAIVVGNESNGVRKEILDRCTDYVKIPMVEGQSSLNIAIASALLLYEYNRVNFHGRSGAGRDDRLP